MRFVSNYPETTGLEGDLLDSGALDKVACAAERAGFDGSPSPNIRRRTRGGSRPVDTRRSTRS